MKSKMDSETLNRALAMYQNGNIDDVADLLDVVTPVTPRAPSQQIHKYKTKPQTIAAPGKVKFYQPAQSDIVLDDRGRMKQQLKTNNQYPVIVESITPGATPREPAHGAKLHEQTGGQRTEDLSANQRAPKQMTSERAPKQMTSERAPKQMTSERAPKQVQQNEKSVSEAVSLSVGQQGASPTYEKVIGSNLPPEVEHAMLRWLKLEEDAAQLRSIKREIDGEKTEIETHIKQFMANWKIGEIGPDEDIGLRYEISESRQGYSKKFITDCFEQILPSHQAEKLLEMLEARRQVTEKSKLKLKKPKAPKKT